MLADIDAVTGFWSAAGEQRWFARSEAFDRDCEARFLATHFAAARRELEHWTERADGVLALLILLDQVPRNVFRGSAHSYATDPLARHYAARGVDAGFDRQVERAMRIFFYLPFTHSEDIADQERSLLLHRTFPGSGQDTWAARHHEVIRRFGRFPHRNAALGRATTPEEQAWLDAGGGFG